MYQDDPTWREVQDYLPLQNRLTTPLEPEEQFVELSDGNRIHIDRYVPLNPKATILLFHGVGGNGRLLSFLAVPLYKRGYTVICPDMPLYGYSEHAGSVSYDIWVRNAVELTEYFTEAELPMFLFGLSAGGMLAYQAACQASAVRGVLVTCILDQRLQVVRESTASHPLLIRLGLPVLGYFTKWLPQVRVPMKWCANMRAIVNNKPLAKLLMKDRRSSGATVTLEFLNTMLHPALLIEPEEFTIPFALLHPAEDLWTPISLSHLFYDKLKCEKEMHLLPGAGHFPIEEQGLIALVDKSVAFMEKHGVYPSML